MCKAENKCKIVEVNMDAEKVIIKAITTGSCPIDMMHVSKQDWNCKDFNSCEECAKELLNEYVKSKEREVS